MKKIMLLSVFFIFASCASKNYKATDYAHACVDNGSKDVDEKISHLCMPIDTYDDRMKYHSMRPSEMRKMPTLDDVMD